MGVWPGGGIDLVVTNPMHAWSANYSLVYLVAGYGGIGSSGRERMRVGGSECECDHDMEHVLHPRSVHGVFQEVRNIK